MHIKTLTSAIALTLAAALPAAALPVQWSAADGGNDHWYELVWDHGSISWTDARAKAEASSHGGQFGYLATVTSAAEQLFLNAINADFVSNSPYHWGTYTTAWLGGSDRDGEGHWEWVTGETFDYENWAPFQPNNFLNQDYLVGWAWGDEWDDCWNKCLLPVVQKYVVEYDNAPSAVPLPATLPLVALGLGGMGIVSRRRRTAA